MFRYEIKKAFSKTSSKIALLLLILILGITCKVAANVYYVNENGQKETGIEAIRKLRTVQKKWAGKLDEEKIRAVKVLGLLPDRLLQINIVLHYFDLYECNGRVSGALPILLVVYGICAIVLFPILYQEYRKKQMN